MSLNPCFSGTYSQRMSVEEFLAKTGSLNPCFSGTYSQSRVIQEYGANGELVLILVLVEHTLRGFRSLVSWGEEAS